MSWSLLKWCRKRNGERETPIQHLFPELPLAGRSQIEQVLHNLLDNSIKYSQMVGDRTAAQVVDNKLLVSVRDQGIGIASDQRKKIFEIQKRPKRTTWIQGLGWG